MTLELAVVAAIVAGAAAFLVRAFLPRRHACAKCALLKKRVES